MRNVAFLIKPSSSACNMRCKYCFYADVANSREVKFYGNMSEEVLENLVKRAFDSATESVTFSFQGGEPTLVGLDFYKKLLSLQKQYNKRNVVVNNTIQTNGYEIDDEWAIFLAKNGASKEEIRSFIERKFRYDLSVSLEAIRDTYVFDSRASYSVPPAIIAFLESHDYESAVRSAISLGGDADTQACIAGGIAEAFYGDIPDNIKRFCNFKIDSSIRNTVKEFCKLYDIKINN